MAKPEFIYSPLSKESFKFFCDKCNLENCVNEAGHPLSSAEAQDLATRHSEESGHIATAAVLSYKKPASFVLRRAS